MIIPRLETRDAMLRKNINPDTLDFNVEDVDKIDKMTSAEGKDRFEFVATVENDDGRQVKFRALCWKSPEVQTEQLVGGRISFSDHGKEGEEPFWMLTRAVVRVDITDQLTGSEEAD